MDAWSALPLQPHLSHQTPLDSERLSQSNRHLHCAHGCGFETELSMQANTWSYGVIKKKQTAFTPVSCVFSTVLTRTTFSSAFLECEDARSSFSPRVQAAVTGFFSPTDWCQVSFPRSLHAVFVGFISSCISLWNIQSCVLELQ